MILRLSNIQTSQWRTDLGRFMRFGITGTLSSLLHYFVYCLVLSYVGATWAYTIGYAVGLICNYVLTTYFTFHSHPSRRNAAGFVASHILNYLLEIILLQFFLLVGLSEWLAPLAVMAIVVPINFLLLRYVFVHQTKPLLFVHDSGQMCNNVLQYANVYAWAKENGRMTISMRFAYKYPYFRISHTRWHNFIVYVLAKLFVRLRLIPTITFHDYATSEAEMDTALRQHKVAFVTGWHVRFPSLFTKYRKEILDLFAFMPDVEAAVQSCMAPWAERTDVIRLGFHIRRGDYARFLNGRYFYDDDTMICLIREFQALHPEKQLIVFVCGNDPNLKEETYQREVNSATFVFPHGNPGEDLCLLSHCDYIMGPPSTFSLLAALYQDRPIWWIKSKEEHLSADSFKSFDEWSQTIVETFMP